MSDEPIVFIFKTTQEVYDALDGKTKAACILYVKDENGDWVQRDQRIADLEAEVARLKDRWQLGKELTFRIKMLEMLADRLAALVLELERLLYKRSPTGFSGKGHLGAIYVDEMLAKVEAARKDGLL